jgi:hypothetical protein
MENSGMNLMRKSIENTSVTRFSQGMSMNESHVIMRKKEVEIKSLKRIISFLNKNIEDNIKP